MVRPVRCAIPSRTTCYVLVPMTPDPWAITLSGDAPAQVGEGQTRACLVRLVTCDRPRAPSARHLLDDEVRIRRAPLTGAARRGAVLELGVADRRLSSEHCELIRDGAGWLLRDRGSKNGTAINGVPVREQRLADGDTIEAGQTFFLFRERVAVMLDEPLDLDAEQLRSLVTFDPDLAAAFAQLGRIAPVPVHVLVLGPSGSGKELVARALHASSGRTGPFVAVNCGALPEALVEAELFGNVKGAFSGATTDRLGFLRSAEGGTLFLDEVGDLRPGAQPALLRVLQEREVVPVGTARAHPLDIRVISATHRDLPALVAAGLFRDDLLARLRGFAIALPPLSRRRCDLGLLVGSLLGRLAPSRDIGFTPEALRRLVAHTWPANVRELENALASAIALTDGAAIDVAALPESLREGCAPAATGELSEAELQQRAELVALLHAHTGNISAMARASGWTRMQLHRRLARYDLDAESFRRRRRP
jgi:transcriptional regulator with PAS, ATPase and Fis domain